MRTTKSPSTDFASSRGFVYVLGERCTPSLLLWERWLSAAKLDEMGAATGKPSNMVMHCEARKSPASACLSLLTLGLPFPQFSFNSARCPASSRTISKTLPAPLPHTSPQISYMSPPHSLRSPSHTDIVPSASSAHPPAPFPLRRRGTAHPPPSPAKAPAVPPN